ncbi:MAG: glycoside hydrolase family 88 protein, partial [Flavobacterium sp.]|nr:glycoside hydrolase family 88 protein [Flavobacterium sp.]
MKEKIRANQIIIWAMLFVLILGLLFVSCKSVQTNTSDKLEVSNKLKWSERMAQTLMIKHPNAFEIDDKTAPKWDYVHGLVMSSFEQLYKKTNNQKYYEYLKGYADATISEDGSIPSYKMENYNIDMIVSGNILFFLYDKTKEDKYLKAMQTMREQIQNQPRTSEGGFWHKKIYPNQMWLDGLYMGSPFYAQYTTKYEGGKQLDDVAKQFELIQKNLLDPKTGLLFHGWDESKEMAWANKET